MDLWRQMGILSTTQMRGLKITLIGAGGIGSPTAMTLAKMGVPELTIYDGDSVSPHNLPNQLFRLGDIGKMKVVALQELLGEISDTKVEIVPSMFDGSQPLSGVVISAVDSMAARKMIWEAVKYKARIPLYIEARMGAEVLRLHTLRPFDPLSVE